jgi:4a-hydroxytetrahydrobiopterin dehydratase
METQLENKHCKPCEAGIPPLDAKQVDQLLTQIPGWEVNAKNTAISRELKFKNFFRTMSFVNALAYLANQENHHPDFQVTYNTCKVQYTTHAIDGLSVNDFICAQKVNLLLDF